MKKTTAFPKQILLTFLFYSSRNFYSLQTTLFVEFCFDSFKYKKHFQFVRFDVLLDLCDCTMSHNRDQTTNVTNSQVQSFSFFNTMRCDVFDVQCCLTQPIQQFFFVLEHCHSHDVHTHAAINVIRLVRVTVQLVGIRTKHRLSKSSVKFIVNSFHMCVEIYN